MAPCVCNVPNCPFPEKENWRVVLMHYREVFAVYMEEWSRQVAEAAKQLEVANISGTSTKASRKKLKEAFKAAWDRPTEECQREMERCRPIIRAALPKGYDYIMNDFLNPRGWESAKSRVCLLGEEDHCLPQPWQEVMDEGGDEAMEDELN